MRVKVIKEFIDIHTNDYYPIGTELAVTEERYTEIQGVGNFVVPYTEEQPETPAVPETDETEKTTKRDSKKKGGDE
jgi:hypothetical protein